MKEVTESDVQAFLKEKRTEGYLLCGLEQTTTSTPLQKFDFPAKCVLLLGTLHQAIKMGERGDPFGGSRSNFPVPSKRSALR